MTVFTVSGLHDQLWQFVEFFTVGSCGPAVDGAPESSILSDGLANRFAAVVTHEAEDVAWGKADIHRGKVEAANILDLPAESEFRPLLKAV